MKFNWSEKTYKRKGNKRSMAARKAWCKRKGHDWPRTKNKSLVIQRQYCKRCGLYRWVVDGVIL